MRVELQQLARVWLKPARRRNCNILRLFYFMAYQIKKLEWVAAGGEYWIIANHLSPFVQGSIQKKAVEGVDHFFLRIGNYYSNYEEGQVPYKTLEEAQRRAQESFEWWIRQILDEQTDLQPNSFQYGIVLK